MGCAHATITANRCEACGAACLAGHYRIEKVIAQTPHSRVYRARDVHGAGPSVALKELQFARAPTAQDIDAFEREAQVLKGLAHPAIPHFVESFREGAGVALRLYLAFELIEGESLGQRLVKRRLTEVEAVSVAEQVLEILGYLHTRTPAVLHRDLKPDNIVFRADGKLVLVDFGSVRHLTGSRTHRGTLVGTFGYMPPEQLGGTVAPSSDLYALGATLLHAVTGIAPAELLEPSMALKVPPTVPPKLRGWISRAVRLDTRTRFQSVSDARLALRAPLTGEFLKPQVRPSRVLPAVLAVAAVAAGWVFLSPRLEGAPTSSLVMPEPVQVGGWVGELPGAQDAARWFVKTKPSCNTVEVAQAMRDRPPPKSVAGQGYGAACFALGGQLARARTMIQGLDGNGPYQAAGIVFELAHPIADRGDDISTAPIMKLVLEFWPNHYQALYHAGISEYATGDNGAAIAHLEEFLRLYKNEDGFTANGRRVLERLKAGLAPEARDLGNGGH